jgi:hypothetical protein
MTFLSTSSARVGLVAKAAVAVHDHASIMRLLPEKCGSAVVSVRGKDLLQLPNKARRGAWQDIRWFSGADDCPDPAFSGFSDCRNDQGAPRDYGPAVEQAADMLAHVGIPNAKRRMNNYPHQFSAGCASVYIPGARFEASSVDCR